MSNHPSPPKSTISTTAADPPLTLPTRPPQPLPPPQTFDFLPALHTLLTRLLHPPLELSQSSSADVTAPGYLDTQQLVTEAAGLKIRLQKARAAVATLPDMVRTVEEQEAEIQELEARISEQREILRDILGKP
ncbi:MAG: hypothetical protein M1829_002528 [Trizodia sp. TS-e1964]|nr:MAG: hypothetical protein M1829_002528 [Trizodia sp. TS-e1964]